MRQNSEMTFKGHSRSSAMSRFDFLLPFHGNYGSILCRFPLPDTGQKWRNLYSPPVFKAAVEIPQGCLIPGKLE